ncbi:hypothetical protein TcasGA2_TC003681 [Tribolium castaneum]|uniref:Uncharacterized protein n=1 Tax=Tribolium castaneum TaxID=7070 RepID=D6WDL2_TRICA|nr:hypothetical protein TcasGA2_TC003681 [Tribolium castaneum]
MRNHEKLSRVVALYFLDLVNLALFQRFNLGLVSCYLLSTPCHNIASDSGQTFPRHETKKLPNLGPDVVSDPFGLYLLALAPSDFSVTATTDGSLITADIETISLRGNLGMQADESARPMMGPTSTFASSLVRVSGCVSGKRAGRQSCVPSDNAKGPSTMAKGTRAIVRIDKCQKKKCATHWLLAFSHKHYTRRTRHSTRAAQATTASSLGVTVQSPSCSKVAEALLHTRSSSGEILAALRRACAKKVGGIRRRRRRRRRGGQEIQLGPKKALVHLSASRRVLESSVRRFPPPRRCRLPACASAARAPPRRTHTHIFITPPRWERCTEKIANSYKTTPSTKGREGKAMWKWRREELPATSGGG